MFRLSHVFCIVTLLVLPASLLAEQTQARFALRALGVKVGEFTLDGSASASRYSVSAQLATTGLVGAIKQVRFVIQASGRRKGDRFIPQHYVEDMDTGQRQSRARLTYSGGVATASGSEIGERTAYSVTDQEQRGAVDPLTAIFMVLRDQRPEDLCRLRQKIYDGERLTEIALTRRVDSGGAVRCSGAFTRLSGYAPDDLRKGSRFPLTVTYEAQGGVMRAVHVQAQTVYGAATVVRK